ncbi:hypothetical protein LOAG_17064 [Loa loa]|uniref:Rapamycin-insensitive companion of mTOR domain-containing protein n=1 Tax=Loa loa TaxID=7209 RepID=A0A1S0UJI5_LOALO|nr:hypothetical protein LOAG_17064 [Loa loa]EJD75850.1 hypothetical protein LOAG_17064 [Loa loa]
MDKNFYFPEVLSAGRKWTTQFLSILVSHNTSDFSVWVIKLLLGQLADSSAKVVRHALRLLHRWIPHYPESVYLIKGIRFDAFGDAGTLLKTYLFSSESYVKNNYRDTLATLDYWKRKFNIRYVEIIDEDVRVALLDSKRSIDGRYARSSNERTGKLGVPMPVHLYGQLAQHDTGRGLLLRSKEVERLLDVLRGSPLPADTYQTSKLKGALYALGHIVVTLNPSFLPVETVPIICRFAECCPILSIRGTAFWVLNLIGNTERGSTLLLSLGWESSNFIVTKRKSNMLLFKAANIDINKIWIQCIDGKLLSQHEISLKDKSPTFITDKNGIVSFIDSNDLADGVGYKSKCTCAVDAITISGQDSTVDKLDYGAFWYGKLNYPFGIRHFPWCTTFEPENHLFDHDTISTMGTTEEEIIDCLMIRSKFRLPPFSLDRAFTFSSSFESPINCTAMSNDKFLFCCGFRYLMESEHTKPSRKSDSETTGSPPISLFGQSISLPRSPDLFLRSDIFVDEDFTEHNCHSSLFKREHRISNCFYCSWPEEYFGSKNFSEFEVPSEARDEIMSVFLPQGSKCSVSPKKLLKVIGCYSFDDIWSGFPKQEIQRSIPHSEMPCRSKSKYFLCLI